MLEYNADTPSLQLETGILSAEWFENNLMEPLPNTHQSNYIDAAYEKAL